MRTVTIIHNELSKQSRDFVAAHMSRPSVVTLVDCDEVRLQHPYISAFPTVLVPHGEYVIPEHQVDDPQNPGQQVTVPAETVPAGHSYLRAPQSWSAVEAEIARLESLGG